MAPGEGLVHGYLATATSTLGRCDGIPLTDEGASQYPVSERGADRDRFSLFCYSPTRGVWQDRGSNLQP